MLVLQQGNLALRFVLEMVLLIAVGMATVRIVGHPVLGPAAAAVVVISLATAWALLVHSSSVPAPVRAATQAAALVIGTLAIAYRGEAWQATAVAAAAVVNALLLSLWNQ